VTSAVTELLSGSDGDPELISVLFRVMGLEGKTVYSTEHPALLLENDKGPRRNMASAIAKKTIVTPTFVHNFRFELKRPRLLSRLGLDAVIEAELLPIIPDSSIY
jgi:hypothetical protein